MGALDGAFLGQILAFASAASFAVANNLISRTGRSGGDKGVMFSVLVTAAMSAALWLALEAGRPAVEGGAVTLAALAWFAAAGVMAMVLGRNLVFESIRRLGVTRATAVKRLNPFFSVLLAALVLGEAVTPIDGAGMAVIALSFGLLIRESFRRPRGGPVEGPPPSAYTFGMVAALAYASAYVIRKIGLETMHAPAFGTMVSALTGLAVFAVRAAFVPRYRTNFTGMFKHLDVWVVSAAVMISLGQIFLFAALSYEKVSTVAMIASLEIFVSILLSLLVFRNEARPSATILVAAGLAMVGVVLVAAS